MKANIFIRESKPKTLVRFAPTAQPTNAQPKEKEYFFSMSVVIEDDVFENIGIINLNKDCKKLILDEVTAGRAVSGESAKGPYKMVQVEFDPQNLFKVGKGTHLTSIEGVYRNAE